MTLFRFHSTKDLGISARVDCISGVISMVDNIVHGKLDNTACAIQYIHVDVSSQVITNPAMLSNSFMVLSESNPHFKYQSNRGTFGSWFRLTVHYCLSWCPASQCIHDSLFCLTPCLFLFGVSIHVFHSVRDGTSPCNSIGSSHRHSSHRLLNAS
jgi:hypothetical protein